MKEFANFESCRPEGGAGGSGGEGGWKEGGEVLDEKCLLPGTATASNLG